MTQELRNLQTHGKRKRKWYLLLCLFTFLPLSCEKEIDLDYHKVAQLYVAEGLVTQDGSTNRTNRPTYVRLTTTQDMTDNESNSHNLAGATIVLSEGDMVVDTLRYLRYGYYVSDYKGFEGSHYTIDIYIDGNHFQSSSVMQAAPQLKSFRFVWKDVLTERMLFADLKLDDIQGQNNYYFMHIYRNGIGYRWAVMRDDQNPNKELQQLFTFFREGSDDSDVLQEGDRLYIEIRAIDQRAYDYLYSMQIMDDTGTNPIPNFTGECLGYFSAYHQITYDCYYHLSDVEESESQ